MIVLRILLGLWALRIAWEVWLAFVASVFATDAQWLVRAPLGDPQQLRRQTMVGGQFLFALLLVCIFLITHL